MTEQLHFDCSLSCVGEGNGNPLQYSYLENPGDRGAWWAAVYGVTQSRARLKRLSLKMYLTRLTQHTVPLGKYSKQKECHCIHLLIHYLLWWVLGFSRWLSGKESTCQCRRQRRCGFDPWVGKIPWRRAWQPTPVFLPGKFHGQRNLVGYTVPRVAKSQTWLSDWAQWQA